MRCACLTTSVAASIALLGGCASRPLHAAERSHVAAPIAASSDVLRRPDEIAAGLERAKESTPFLPMLGDDDARRAMPSIFKRGGAPFLIRVGGLQPRTMEAVMAMARQMRTEGGLDEGLLDDVFWVVSSENECFY